MGRHTVEISQKDLHLYSRCNLCNISIYKDGINRARLIQDYNKHINSRKHIDLTKSNDNENNERDLKIMLGDLQKQLDNVFKILDTYDKKIIKLNNNMVAMQSLIDRRTIIINNSVQEEKIVEPPTPSPSVSSVSTVSTVSTPILNVTPTTKYSNSDSDSDDREEVNCYNDDELREKLQTADSYELIQTDMENFENFKEYMINKTNDNNDSLSAIGSEIENIILWFVSFSYRNKVGVDKVEIERIQNELQSIYDIVEEIDNNYFDVVIDGKELNKLFQSIVRISKNTYNKININNKWLKI